jgi:hypothetical protein
VLNGSAAIAGEAANAIAVKGPAAALKSQALVIGLLMKHLVVFGFCFFKL